MDPAAARRNPAFAHALTNNKDGFTTLLAVVAPNLLVKPATVLFNKVTIKNATQAVQMFGPAQHGVAMAVADSVAAGVIPVSEADNLFICVGVFIHWDAKDNKKIQDFNYQATKEFDRARHQRRADTHLCRCAAQCSETSLRAELNNRHEPALLTARLANTSRSKTRAAGPDFKPRVNTSAPSKKECHRCPRPTFGSASTSRGLRDNLPTPRQPIALRRAQAECWKRAEGDIKMYAGLLRHDQKDFERLDELLNHR